MEIWWWTQSVGRGKKAHVKHHWKEVSQEKVMRQHSTGPVRAASKVLCLSSLKKKESYKQISKRFQMPKETLMRTHSSLNWTNIPGIQSHHYQPREDSSSVLGTGFFSTSGSTHRNDHLYTHYSPDTSSLIEEVIPLLVPWGMIRWESGNAYKWISIIQWSQQGLI